MKIAIIGRQTYRQTEIEKGVEQHAVQIVKEGR